MRSQDNGHLTAADRAKLQQQQNQVSNQIGNDTKNAQTRHNLGGEAGTRVNNQQQRIAQGLDNHSLDASQAAHLENEEKQVTKEVANDRAANHGGMTKAEQQQVNRQQNQISKQIHQDKTTGKGKHNK
jgi:hypothetical protein